MDTSKRDIAIKLRAAREPTGLNQAEMAEMLGIARNTYAVWESETIQRRPPSSLKLIKVARFYGLEPQVFHDGEVSPEQVSALVHANLHDESKAQIPINTALAQREKQLNAGVKLMDDGNYQANTVSMLTVTEGPPHKTISEESGSQIERPSRPLMLSSLMRRKATLGPNRIPAGVYLRSVSEALYAAARFHLMQISPEMALDQGFNKDIVWTSPSATDGAKPNLTRADFYFLGHPQQGGGVLADFNTGHILGPGAPNYSNEAYLDQRIGHLLKLEKMTGRKVRKKLLLVFDTERLVMSHPMFERERRGGMGEWGVKDRIGELKEVAEICDVDIQAVETPEQIARILYEACTGN